MNATTPLSERIITIGAPDLQWPFRDGLPKAEIRSRLSEDYYATVAVDPFPCYAHDPEIVAEMAAQVECQFPMGYEVFYYLLSNEDAARTNGHANRLTVYTEERPHPYEPYVVLSGKRIPLHPGMTRYLVAHEYGHLVQWWIERKRGIKDETTTQFDREYADLRGVAPDNGYGGGRWHSNIGELIANDFRICVCGVEEEFWPHPGFDHPRYLPHVQNFWYEMIRLYACDDPTPVTELAKAA